MSMALHIKQQGVNYIDIMQGTIANPINLDLQDSQGQQDIEEQLEAARRKELLDEAKMSRNPIQLALAVIKTTIKGQLGIKNKTLNRAIIKFFQGRLGINVSLQHFHPRKDPDYEDNSINPRQFLLYGVDFLTTAMIQDRFKMIDTTIQQILWINSSTCKIVYKTESQAKLVLQSQVIDRKSLQFKQDEESDGHLQGWFTLKPYHFLSFQRQLIMRYSTQKENSLQKEQMNKYKEYESAYAQLLPQLFVQFKAQPEYQKVVKEIQMERQEFARNRNDYHRNRRTHNPFHGREHSRERSRTRDRRFIRNRRNQNSQEKDQNNSFHLLKKNESFTSRRGKLNDSNLSFEMIRGAEAYRNRQDLNAFNTSFEIKQTNQYNQRNQRNTGRWQRNNRPEQSHKPNEFEVNVINQVVYEHRPVQEKHMSLRNNNQQILPAPRKNNVYYDCNIDQQEQLSYQFLPQPQHSRSESDNLEDASFRFNKKPTNPNNQSKQIDKHQLSYIISSLKNSKEDYTNKNMDSSFVINKSSLNKSLVNEDLSMVLNNSKISEKPNQSRIDFNQLFNLNNEDISPIHQQQSLDTSFVMKEPEVVKKANNRRDEGDYIDFKKPKPKRHFDDDEGY